MEILGFGTYDSRRHPRVAVILDGLRESGDRVEELNAPLELSTEARVDLLRRPWRLPVLGAAMAGRWLTLGRRVRAARRRPGGLHPDAVVVGYMGQFDVVLARLLFPSRRTRLVLDLLVSGADTARDRAVTGGPRMAALAALDRLAGRMADVIVVDTDESAGRLPPAGRDRAVVVPVGASEEWFRAGLTAPDGDGAAPLRAVFFGLYTPLQGAPVLARALHLLEDQPGLQVTMIGTGQDYARARLEAGAGRHVTWLDWVDPDRLPGVVAAHDVCFGIFGTTPKAARVVPNKVYQGAAAGCAVITSDTAPQRRALGDAALYVPAGDPAAIAAAVRSLAADRSRLAGLRRAASARAAARFSPPNVVGPLRRRLAAGGDRTY